MRLAALGAMIGYALAASAEEPTPSKARTKRDPNEIVCEKQEVLGSRLAVRRVCMTRAEWAEKRRADRDLIDKTQLGPCVKEAGC
jgi:hypothetical protein